MSKTNQIKQKIEEKNKDKTDVLTPAKGVSGKYLETRRKELKGQLNEALNNMRTKQREIQDLDKKAFEIQSQLKLLNEMLNRKKEVEKK